MGSAVATPAAVAQRVIEGRHLGLGGRAASARPALTSILRRLGRLEPYGVAPRAAHRSALRAKGGGLDPVGGRALGQVSSIGNS